jgi:hypothetical protein
METWLNIDDYWSYTITDCRPSNFENTFEFEFWTFQEVLPAFQLILSFTTTTKVIVYFANCRFEFNNRI